jgi:hypothetical protein
MYLFGYFSSSSYSHVSLWWIYTHLTFTTVWLLLHVTLHLSYVFLFCLFFSLLLLFRSFKALFFLLLQEKEIERWLRSRKEFGWRQFCPCQLACFLFLFQCSCSFSTNRVNEARSTRLFFFYFLSLSSSFLFLLFSFFFFSTSRTR